jgi:hypothetical protein
MAAFGSSRSSSQDIEKITLSYLGNNEVIALKNASL